METTHPEPSVTTRQRVKPIRTMLIAVALLTALSFFLNKPFHIDDPVVLHVAENISKDPLRPLDGSFFWLSEPGPLFEITTNPPIVSYYLAPWIALFGCREWSLHGAMLLFVGLLAWGMGRLAKRFVSEDYASWAVWLLMLSPAILPSVNVMRDVPMVALCVSGLAFWIEGVEQKKRSWLIWGALLGGLAALTKYTALIWIGLAFLYAMMRRRGSALPYLVLALLPIALWCLHNHFVYHRIHLLYLLENRVESDLQWQDKWYGALSGLGACLPMWFAWIIDQAVNSWQWAVERSRRLEDRGWIAGWQWMWGSLVLGVMVVSFTMTGFYMDRKVYPQVLLWMQGGMILLIASLFAHRPISDAQRLVPSARHPTRDIFLILWLLMGLVASIEGIPFQAVRHLLFIMPPIILLLVPSFVTEVGLRLAMGLHLVLLVMVFAADYEYANVHRRFAQETRAKLPDQRIWYGGSWGWMFYAEQQGFQKILPGGEGMKAGDWVVLPERVFKGKMPNLSGRLELREERAYGATIPLRTMHLPIGASYYALVRGSAPYIFTLEQPLEVVRIYQLK